MKRVLPVIVISQFFCTPLWFAGNAILPDLAKHFHLENANLAHFISAVQFGFITGVLSRLHSLVLWIDLWQLVYFFVFPFGGILQYLVHFADYSLVK
jgi:hypothetical protein